MNPVEELHKKLILIQSPSNNENEIGNFIFELLKVCDFDVIKNIVDDGGFNIVAKSGKPKIFLAAHMDTVLPFLNYKETKNEVFGRGACDTKGSLASMITAGIKAKGDNLTDFGFIFTVGEEVDFRGVKNIVKSKIDIPFVIVGEPTSLDIINAHHGVLVLKLIAKGKSAHSSKPNEGINAIEIILDGLNKILQFKLHDDTLLNLSRINGGIADNIIPNNAEATLSLRISPDDKTDYLKEIKKILAKIEVKKILEIEGVKTKVPKELSFIKKIRSVRYATELSFFKNGIVLGPGDIKHAHGDNERIFKKELNQAVDVYYKIIKNFNK